MLQPNVLRYQGTKLWNIGDILCLKYRLFPVMSKYDVINVQPTMQCKEYLNLLVCEVVCQSSPQQKSLSVLSSWPWANSTPHFPLSMDNHSISGHDLPMQPLISDHVTKLYNSYIVEELLPPLPLLQIPVTWPMSHDQMHESSILFRSPLLLHQGLPLGYISWPRIW